MVSSESQASANATAKKRGIQERSVAYALRAIKLYQFLQTKRDGAGWVIGKQYLRSASSIGGSVQEAQASESRADFIHKMGVAQKEAKESLYWLRLLRDSGIVPKNRMQDLMQETGELVSVITAIVLTSKRKSH